MLIFYPAGSTDFLHLYVNDYMHAYDTKKTQKPDCEETTTKFLYNSFL